MPTTYVLLDATHFMMDDLLAPTVPEGAVIERSTNPSLLASHAWKAATAGIICERERDHAEMLRGTGLVPVKDTAGWVTRILLRAEGPVEEAKLRPRLYGPKWLGTRIPYRVLCNRWPKCVNSSEPFQFEGTGRAGKKEMCRACYASLTKTADLEFLRTVRDREGRRLAADNRKDKRVAKNIQHMREVEKQVAREPFRLKKKTHRHEI